MKSRALRGASVQAGSLCEPACERVGAVRCLLASGRAEVGSAWRAPLSLAGMRPRKALFERRTTMCFRSVDEGLPGVRQEQQAGGDRMRGVRCRPGRRSAGPRCAHGACGARCPCGSQLAGCACGSQRAEASRRLGVRADGAAAAEQSRRAAFARPGNFDACIDGSGILLEESESS